MHIYMKYIISLFIVLFVLMSCKTKQKLVYFQNDATTDTVQTYRTVIEADDFISIVVTAEDTEQAAQFNLPVQGSQATNGGYIQGNSERGGYLIDKEGYINFPVLGKIHVASLEKSEVIALLEEKISAYINQPIVDLQIQNFKVTVLGSVSRPGTFRIPNERITLLEALGLAGDLDLTGVRNNVLVIREVEGIKQEYRVDLTSKELFSSPVYYLKQNDVVYVEPNMAARSQSTFIRSNSGVFASIISVVVSTLSTITIISQL